MRGMRWRRGGRGVDGGKQQLCRGIRGFARVGRARRFEIRTHLPTRSMQAPALPLLEQRRRPQRHFSSDDIVRFFVELRAPDAQTAVTAVSRITLHTQKPKPSTPLRPRQNNPPLGYCSVATHLRQSLYHQVRHQSARAPSIDDHHQSRWLSLNEVSTTSSSM